MGSHKNDPAFIEQIVALTRDGHSRMQVAAMLHVSRNTVCGVVTRAGISPGRTHAWTPERIDAVRALAKQGYSQQAIATALGTSGSRINNVIRRHIPELVGHFAHGPRPTKPRAPRKPTARTSSQVMGMQAAAKARAAYVPPPAEAPTPTMVTLMELTPTSCKWPLDDGPVFHFCGAARWVRGPYCHHHHGRAFVAR